MNYGSPEPVGTASQHASVPVSSAPAAPAVQSSLSGVGLTGKDIEKWAAAITKAFLTSPAFQKAYAAEIKESHRAVDHGIDPETYGQSSTMDPAAMAAVPMVNMMRSAFSHEPLKAQFDQERQNLAQTIKEETGAERDKAQKYLAKLSAIASLATSNSDEFKKQYTLAMSANLGGPDTEAKLQAINSGADERDRIIAEQREWNRWNLNGILKRKLTYFVAQREPQNIREPVRQRAATALRAPSSRRRHTGSRRSTFRPARGPRPSTRLAAR